MTAFNGPVPGHTPRFGRASFISAAIGGFLNVTSLFSLGFAYFFLGLFFLVELAVIAVLYGTGGRARQVGVGLAVTFLSTLAIIVLMLCTVWLRDHWIR
ncbi:hypothetical protein OHB26_38460 [Nocardia sp. NBC_01503]|uniref:hypothetical protein n=1 Tax=Nocardia sp. NBC_01503 TaxID=2975997 RepID=UPI002E7B158F|nr:hypothetical protein [Nocardia sp. NBC_01503]WTL32663.1 hypothetical protein OHB26_38460 [Nocardia sp. NBC_01503]